MAQRNLADLSNEELKRVIAERHAIVTRIISLIDNESFIYKCGATLRKEKGTIVSERCICDFSGFDIYGFYDTPDVGHRKIDIKLQGEKVFSVCWEKDHHKCRVIAFNDPCDWLEKFLNAMSIAGDIFAEKEKAEREKEKKREEEEIKRKEREDLMKEAEILGLTIKQRRK